MGRGKAKVSRFSAALTPVAALAAVLLIGALAPACSCGGDDGDADAGPSEVTLEHCEYEDIPATAGSGGTVTAGPLMAAADDRVLHIPVGTALGSYTARAGFLGTAGTVDLREEPLSGSFNSSIGIESAPRIKTLVMSAGGENIVIIKLDLGFPYEGMLFDIESRLGAEFSGKVLLTASHSHSAWGQQSGHPVFKVGAGEFREVVYTRYLDQIEASVDAAVAALRPAKFGSFVDRNFDPGNLVTRDRRSENNDLMGGPRKDDTFALLRVDGVDDLPIAVLPVYGVHGTINGEENSLASTDVTGAMERLFEETFDTQVVVMHLQGAGAEVSPTPAGGINCDLSPGDSDDPCFDWLRSEGNARNALPIIEAAFTAAGAAMQTDLELEMMTRSISLGPYADTFTIRDGALNYEPFVTERVADREILDGAGAVISPIDEFNAPVGAALCELDYPIFPDGLMPGTDLIAPYGGCVRIDTATSILGQLLELEVGNIDGTHPVCQTSRTTLTAFRIGELVFGTIPGELSVMIADKIRANSPVDPDKTILIGYSQGQTGYLLTPEDWLLAGFESSINAWGPLEGEYVSEQLIELLPLVTTPARENGVEGGLDRVSTPPVSDSFPFDQNSPMAGTIPAAVPERVWLRSGPVASAQPLATVERVSGLATFVWIGDDPIVANPTVTLEVETTPGVFEPARRRSGRAVAEGDFLLMYTGLPVRPAAGEPQTHYWAIEWQPVPWIGAMDGATSLDGLEARAGLPLGTYRFRVEGAAFDITSNPFDVTATSLAIGAARNANNISATVQIEAPKGYRLLDLTVDSNMPVPVRGGLFTVSMQLTAGPDLQFTDVAIASDGTLTIDAGADAANVVTVTVTDAFGNSGIGAL